MRIAILDGSPVTAWTITRLLPEGVDYEVLPTFEAADRVLSESPPDAILIGITAAHLPWERLLDLCESHCPEIPYLLYYSLRALPPGAPVPESIDSAATAPVEIGRLRLALADLVRRAAANRRREATLSYPAP